MTIQGNGNPFVYVVKLSEKSKSILKEHHRKAALAGAGKTFLSSLRQIHDRLRKEPTVFGEPLYHLPALQLTVFQAVVSPLVVVYGVHDERALVFVQTFKVLS
jgi:hypothetical protein